MLKRINMGILGAGNIAGTMAETVNKMPGVKCYAIASRSQEKAESFGAAHGILFTVSAIVPAIFPAPNIPMLILLSIKPSSVK